MARTISEKILSDVKVRVFKVTEDDRTSLCGEPVKKDKGKSYFEIPAHQADYVKSLFAHYEVSEEFIQK